MRTICQLADTGERMPVIVTKYEGRNRLRVFKGFDDILFRSTTM